MALSAFTDKSKQPTDKDLAITLGSTFVFWNEMKSRHYLTILAADH